MENCIVINQQKIIRKTNFTRMETEIIDRGEAITLFIDVDNQYEKYLCHEMADHIVYLLIPLALRKGLDIISKISISDVFKHNINEILIPHLLMGDSSLNKINIDAQSIDFINSGKAVGTSVSCGVDATYTAIHYSRDMYKSLKLSHFLLASASIDLKYGMLRDLNEWYDTNRVYFSRSENFAKYYGLPIVKCFSNYMYYICGKNEMSHLCTHNYITMANVLAIKKLFKIYLFSSTYPFTDFSLSDNSKHDTAYYELLSNHILTTPGFYCFSGGAKADRVEKTKNIIDYEVAKKFLHPCFKKDSNCSLPTCSKCLRALLTLDYYEKLDEMRDVFNVELYRKKRMEYLKELCRRKDVLFFVKLYKMFNEKFKEDMDKAELLYQRSISPVPRSEFNVLTDAYQMAIDFLREKNFRVYLDSFLKFKNINELEVVGGSRIGKLITSELKNFISVKNFSGECNSILILNTSKAQIKKERQRLKEKQYRSIIDLYEIHEYVLDKGKASV